MCEICIKEIETKNIMTKSSLPVGGYSVNPYTAVRMPVNIVRYASCHLFSRELPTLRRFSTE